MQPHLVLSWWMGPSSTSEEACRVSLLGHRDFLARNSQPRDKAASGYQSQDTQLQGQQLLRWPLKGLTTNFCCAWLVQNKPAETGEEPHHCPRKLLISAGVQAAKAYEKDCAILTSLCCWHMFLAWGMEFIHLTPNNVFGFE